MGTKRLFILGAGASRFAGYPSAPELWPFVRDHGSSEMIAQRRRAEVVAAVEPILLNFPPPDHDQPDLEMLFTLLDLGPLSSHRFFEVEHFDWKVMRA